MGARARCTVLLILSGCGPQFGTIGSGRPGGDADSRPPTDGPDVTPIVDAGPSTAFDFATGAGGCGLVTCASAHADCGPIGDGCGGVIDCGGACPTGQVCGGGGPSRCGGQPCIPRTCAQAGVDCGPIGDGCGGMITCGTGCPSGQSCGAGGQPGVCATDPGSGCVPKTCAALGLACGPAGDGCGGVIAGGCGSCPSGKSCGGGGTAGVCGAPSCTPRSCAQANADCGPVADGCGGLIPGGCGTCGTGKSCGGAGSPNHCGTGSTGPCTNLCLKQMSCPGSATTSISGTVYAPTNPAAGYGQPDPLYGALVYIPNAAVQSFGSSVACDVCGAAASGAPLVSAVTGPDGKFTLTNAPVGTQIPLVIQLGRWRRQITIPTVSPCTNTALSLNQTRLPRNKSEGDIPKIAISTGLSDSIECVLAKIGIDTAEVTMPSGNGRVHIYNGNGATLGAATPSDSTLWSSLSKLEEYDLVILDCQAGPPTLTATQLANLHAYAAAGGRVFASHYSYGWLSTNSDWATAANWDLDQIDGYADTLTADIDTSTPKGQSFGTWLGNVGALASAPGQMPPQIVVDQARHDVASVAAPSQQFVYVAPSAGTAPDGGTAYPYPNAPLEFTFNTPVGSTRQCGRVLFSDFHVSSPGTDTCTAATSGQFPCECGKPAPMTPQEKVFEFLLFDLSSCVVPPVVMPCVPLTCAQIGASCGPAGNGCGDLIAGGCGTCPAGQTCGGGGVPSVCGAPACPPISCAAQGIACGPAGDGCGGLIASCGDCPPGQSCGGGGVPGQCGATMSCAPVSCTTQGIECGPAGDGCGGLIASCGDCPPDQTCGGGGVPGKCGAPSCSPLTCADVHATCGAIADGCGATRDCGACVAPYSCGGGVTPVANQCGALL